MKSPLTPNPNSTGNLAQQGVNNTPGAGQTPQNAQTPAKTSVTSKDQKKATENKINMLGTAYFADTAGETKPSDGIITQEELSMAKAKAQPDKALLDRLSGINLSDKGAVQFSSPIPPPPDLKGVGWNETNVGAQSKILSAMLFADMAGGAEEADGHITLDNVQQAMAEGEKSQSMVNCLQALAQEGSVISAKSNPKGQPDNKARQGPPPDQAPTAPVNTASATQKPVKGLAA
jgi:hypothetical protein